MKALASYLGGSNKVMQQPKGWLTHHLLVAPCSMHWVVISPDPAGPMGPSMKQLQCPVWGLQAAVTE